MDAIKYLKEKKRLTNECKINCSDCPLEGRKSDEFSCTHLEKRKPEKSVEIVEKWSNEHPVKTYKDVFLEKFPKARLSDYDVPGFCMGYVFGTRNCESKTCAQCWNEEYDEKGE